MKRFTVITALLSVSLLSVWVIFQGFAVPAAPKLKSPNTTSKVYYMSDEMLQALRSGQAYAVPVTGAESRQVAPVFDATGALASDPTGTIWNPSHPVDMKIAPVFDATGAVVSDPTGTLWSANPK